MRLAMSLTDPFSAFGMMTIVENSPLRISGEDLKMVFNFASEGEDDAIIHIGNLLIDKTISIEEFSKSSLTMTSSKYLVWLFRILYQ